MSKSCSSVFIFCTFFGLISGADGLEGGAAASFDPSALATAANSEAEMQRLQGAELCSSISLFYPLFAVLLGYAFVFIILRFWSQPGDGHACCVL